MSEEFSALREGIAIKQQDDAASAELERLKQIDASHTELVIELVKFAGEDDSDAGNPLEILLRIIAEREELRRALFDYAMHTFECPMPPAECSCGLDRLLAKYATELELEEYNRNTDK